ncbi:hypothetical protein N7468_002198 [Penicillium chermesinum]|uniref:Ubiquitin-like domain-containing protein n=1 Tax=Penicillium chermesinum TaxID=63820 RepID=A0A9W9PI56_9EURO|nr:uncharacterized protein N7468_002198 [Penicillium chermesinum]KAJ5247215.1 hypothetical protein N7468_002198 [Penicillium chermesinum]
MAPANDQRRIGRIGNVRAKSVADGNHNIPQNTPQWQKAQPPSGRPGHNPPRRRAPSFPLDQHYNSPVRQHTWNSKRREWTREALDRERTEFFETRVTGRPEVWAALATAITLIRDNDLATAQVILDAAGGVLYRLPQCIVSDPGNMVASEITEEHGREGEEDEEEGVGLDGKIGSGDESEDELIAQDLERRREEKGKTSERDLIRVAARLSDRAADLSVLVNKSQSVGSLARKLQQEAKIASTQRVRIVYLGRMLKESDSLLEQGWQDGHVLNALVVPRRF